MSLSHLRKSLAFNSYIITAVTRNWVFLQSVTHYWKSLSHFRQPLKEIWSFNSHLLNINHCQRTVCSWTRWSQSHIQEQQSEESFFFNSHSFTLGYSFRVTVKIVRCDYPRIKFLVSEALTTNKELSTDDIFCTNFYFSAPAYSLSSI